MRRWRSLLTALGLTRVGRVVFTAVALAGVLLALGDAAIPRSGSEADLGPNAGGAVIAFTIVLLVAVAMTDALARLVLMGVRRLGRFP